MESLKLKIFIIKYYLSLSGSLQEYIYPCQAVYKNISFIGLDRKPIDQERTPGENLLPVLTASPKLFLRLCKTEVAEII